MEDVLEVYQRPYDGNEVLVCMDETSKQQVKETRVPRPAAPGLSAAYDYEYERNGVSGLFMLFAPLDGWRRVEVRERRTKVDWAHVIKKLVDEDYPDRDRIVLVMDNLNTHKLSSLYEAFEPGEARRIAERLEIHYTPKHGSWLNMAEIEIGVKWTQSFGQESRLVKLESSTPIHCQAGTSSGVRLTSDWCTSFLPSSNTWAGVL